MAHPFRHAESSARKFAEKRKTISEFTTGLMSSKAFLARLPRRSRLHHAEGVSWPRSCLELPIVNSDGNKVQSGM